MMILRSVAALAVRPQGHPRRERARPRRPDQTREGRHQRRRRLAARSRIRSARFRRWSLEDGSTLFDSRVILEYLDHRAGGGKIIPQEPKARFAALRLQALADGMTDAQILLVYEGRFRPPEHHVKKWTDYQADKIKRGLDRARSRAAVARSDPERRPDRARLLPRPPRSALRRRLAGRHPKLVAWLDRFAAKVPAFAETKVAA